jgi:uncharacterized protein HemY
MTEQEYERLLDRIKLDLYNEFINPDTATYGIKYVDEDLTAESLTDREILQDELGRLCLLQNKYVDDEEYRKAAITQRKITQLQNKIDKL